jgi:hypothetical protein
MHDHLERMLHDANLEPTQLPLSFLKDITDNFSGGRQIGSGGFAVVYKVSKLYTQLMYICSYCSEMLFTKSLKFMLTRQLTSGITSKRNSGCEKAITNI